MKNSTLLCLAIMALVVGVFIWMNGGLKGLEQYDYVVHDLPTSPEVELIEGRPNFNVVNRATGEQVIREGDIALGAGFGIGEGTVGFGRFGSSFMA